MAHVVRQPDGTYIKVQDDDDDSTSAAPPPPPEKPPAQSTPPVIKGPARDRGTNLQDLVDQMAGTPSNAGKQAQSSDSANKYQ